MTLPSHVSRKLARLLRAECDTYKQYLEVLPDQRKTVTAFKVDQLRELDKKRRELTRRIRAHHEERVELLSDESFEGETRLSTVVEKFGSEAEKAEFLPLIDELRRLVEAARHEATEFQGVQSFALNVVNGSLSILMRATKHVSKQYGKQGKINESYLPRMSRHEGVLKQA